METIGHAASRRGRLVRSTARPPQAARDTTRPARTGIDLGAIAACVFALIVVAITYVRIYFGADFTDQAYYVAVPYRLVLGARPFIDETSASQTAGFVEVPFIWLYHAVVGVTGIMLFERHLHFLFSVGVAVCVFVGLRPFARSASEALLPSLLPIVFMPFNLPDLGYNNLASGFFTAGCFLGLRAFSSQNRGLIAAAGFAHGWAIVSQPAYAVPAFVYGFLLTILERNGLRRFLPLYAVGVLLPLAVLAGIAAHAGFGNARHVFDTARQGESAGPGKAIRVLGQVLALGARAPLGVLSLVAAIVSWRRRRKLAVGFLLLTPLLLTPLGMVTRVQGSLYYVGIYALLALPLFLLRRDDLTARRLFLAVWPTALAGGLAAAWSSTNEVTNFGLGALPGAVVTTLLLARAVDDRWPPSMRRPEVRTLLANSALAVLVALQWTSFYRDSGITTLGSRIRGGAYAGIYTTAAKQKFVAAMTSDLRRLSPGRCRILFYDDFPAGYLLSGSRAYTNAVWLFGETNAERRSLLRYYSARGALPDVIVRVTKVLGFEGAITYSKTDPVDRLVTRSGTYRLRAKRDTYSVYDHRHARCLASAR
jgi:hypothetical protein